MNSWKLSKKGLYFCICILLPFLLFSTSCSNEKMAGNSAETGSPEIASLIVLSNGAPAAFAQVKILDTHFDFYAGDDSSDYIALETDSLGYFAIDEIPFETFSLEIFHEESGEKLLSQNLSADDFSENEIQELQKTGSAKINYDSTQTLAQEDSLTAIVSIIGSTFSQICKGAWGILNVDSLPAGTFDLRVQYITSDTLTVIYDDIKIKSETSTEIAPREIYTKSFAISLDFEDVFDTITPLLLDIPLAIKLDSSNFDMDKVHENRGRFEAYRSRAGEKISVTLPIELASFNAQEVIVWVRVDSLNFKDSILIEYDSEKVPVYASDVFPSNGGFLMTLHFENDETFVKNNAEKSPIALSNMENVKATAGVLGQALEFTETSILEFEAPIKNFATFNFSIYVKTNNDNFNGVLFERENHFKLYFKNDNLVFDLFEYSDTLNLKYEYTLLSDCSILNNWAQIVFQKQGAQESFILNGEKIPFEKTPSELPTPLTPAETIKIGENFVGALDEFTFSKGYRYDSWFFVSHKNLQ